MNRNCLYYIAAAFWGIPGVIITIKGISAYLTMPSRKLWWLDSDRMHVVPRHTASFYSGLGPMLVFAACRFISNRKQI